MPSELHEESSILHSFVFSRRTASFTPTKIAPKQGLLVVIISHKGDKGRIDVLAVDENASITPLATITLPTQKTVRLPRFLCRASAESATRSI